MKKLLLAFLTAFLLLLSNAPTATATSSECLPYNKFQKIVLEYKPVFYKLPKDKAKKFIDWVNSKRKDNSVPALEADEFHIGVMSNRVGSVFSYNGCVLTYTSTGTLATDFWAFMKEAGLTMDDFIKEPYFESSA